MSDAPHQGHLAEALFDAYDEEFELFASDQRVRRVLREAIAGKVKQRSLLRLGFAQGCKVGDTAAGYMHRAQLARALGVEGDLGENLPGWSELLARVRRLARDPS